MQERRPYLRTPSTVRSCGSRYASWNLRPKFCDSAIALYVMFSFGTLTPASRNVRSYLTYLCVSGCFSSVGAKTGHEACQELKICHVRIDILARLNHKAATPWQVCLLLRGRLQHAEECRGTTTAASGPALLRVQYHKGPRAIPPGQTIMLMGCISIIA
jgi:hypothetical protein